MRYHIRDRHPILDSNQELQRRLDDPRVVVHQALPLSLVVNDLASGKLDAPAADVTDVYVLAVETHHVQTLQRRRRDAHHLDHDVGANTVRQFPHPLDSRLRSRVVHDRNGVRGAALHRQIQSRLLTIDDDDLRCTLFGSDRCSEYPQTARALDHNRVAEIHLGTL